MKTDTQTDMILFKAVPGGAMGDLFSEMVPVAGHMRDGHPVRPTMATRRKRRPEPKPTPKPAPTVDMEPEKLPGADKIPSVVHLEQLEAMPDEVIIEEALMRLDKQMRNRRESDAVISSPEEVKRYLKLRFANLPHEVFAAVLMDNRHRVIKVSELFRGTVDGASVHPREVVKEALQHNAAAVIFAHNHPSGLAEPSQADIRITGVLKTALETVDIRVLDHVIVGEGPSTSLQERGLM